MKEFKEGKFVIMVQDQVSDSGWHRQVEQKESLKEPRPWEALRLLGQGLGWIWAGGKHKRHGSAHFLQWLPQIICCLPGP